MSAFGPSGESLSTHAPSYYAATARGLPALAPLATSRSADVVVVGGGYTGLGAARRLAELGHETVLLDAGPIGWGASGRNGGQVHLGWNKGQRWFERRLGAPAAQALWDIAIAARDHLDTLLVTDPDGCDFRPGLIHADHKPGYVADTHADVAHLREAYGHTDLIALDRAALRTLVASPGYHGGSLDRRGGHLHPLKLAEAMARAALAAGATLHPHSPVNALTREGAGWRVVTAQGTMRAAQVLLATGGYARGLSRVADAHVLPINNTIATTAPLDPALAASLISNGAAVADSRFVIYYFRVTPDHRLLFGGGEHYRYRMPRDIAGFVRPHLERVFPQLAGVPLDHAWGGTLSITADRLPWLRQIEPGLWAGAGFSGLGVVLAPYLGRALGEAIAGVPDAAFDRIASLPARRLPGGPLLRWPTMVAAMSLLALRDRL